MQAMLAIAVEIKVFLLVSLIEKNVGRWAGPNR